MFVKFIKKLICCVYFDVLFFFIKIFIFDYFVDVIFDSDVRFRICEVYFKDIDEVEV